MSLTITNLSFAFPVLPVLDGITAEAASGRVTAVLGPNAAGKTTLLRCMLGLLGPQHGRCDLGGVPVLHFSATERARRMAYVAQRPSVAAVFTVREVVELGRYTLPHDPRKVEGALERLELADLTHRPYPALSVGQQQRVALARAVAQLAPDGVLVLDEPVSAMDLRHARACYRLLRELAAGGATVIMAMHDLSAAADVADDAWLLAGGAPGRLEAAGPAEEVLTPDRLARVFGLPFEVLQRGDGSRLLACGPPNGA